ncbi:hypothetical protein [Enterococcus olivae]
MAQIVSVNEKTQTFEIPVQQTSSEELQLENGIKRESDLLKQVSAMIVGLTIAEHLPWHAFHLRQTLEQLAIFQNEEEKQ